MSTRSGPKSEGVWWRRRGYVLVASISVIIFMMRGPVRALGGGGLNDLLSPYAQSAAWVHGADPYSAESLLRFWPKDADRAMPAAREMHDGSVLVRHGIPTAYPLTCFVLLAPFTVIPFSLFKALWVVASGVLFFATVRSLISMAGMDERQKKFFVIGSVLLAPFHTGIATCNPAIIAIELGVIAAWAAQEERRITGGILMAICVGLKPQIGLCFLAFHIVRRHWRACYVALGAVFAATSAGILRLNASNARWLASYELDTHALLGGGVLGDFTERNPTRFGLVNLQVSLYALFHNRNVANLSALLCCSVLFAVLLFLVSTRRAQDGLLCLSAISTFSLLPFYHRFYDAGLLIIALGWLVKSVVPEQPGDSPPRASSIVGLLMISAFAIPGGSLLETLRARSIISPILSTQDWWNGFFMAHSGWCLLMLSLVLLYQVVLQRGTTRMRQPLADAISQPSFVRVIVQ